MVNAARQGHCGTGASTIWIVGIYHTLLLLSQIRRTSGMKGLNPVQPCLVRLWTGFHYFSILCWGKVPEPGGIIIAHDDLGSKVIMHNNFLRVEGSLEARLQFHVKGSCFLSSKP